MMITMSSRSRRDHPQEEVLNGNHQIRPACEYLSLQIASKAYTESTGVMVWPHMSVNGHVCGLYIFVVLYATGRALPRQHAPFCSLSKLSISNRCKSRAFALVATAKQTLEMRCLVALARVCLRLSCVFSYKLQCYSCMHAYCTKQQAKCTAGTSYTVVQLRAYDVHQSVTAVDCCVLVLGRPPTQIYLD